MELKIWKENEKQYFLHINQWDKTLTKRACTQYWAYINYRYNVWINQKVRDENEKWIEEWVKEAQKIWLLWIKTWWSLHENNDFVADRIWANCLMLDKDNDIELLKDLYSKGFMIGVWIKTDKEFVLDRLDDWIINKYKNYIEYVNDKIIVRHRTNIIFREWKNIVYDNYFDRNWDWSADEKDHNTYEISNFDEFIKYVCYKHFYVFI